MAGINIFRVSCFERRTSINSRRRDAIININMWKRSLGDINKSCMAYAIWRYITIYIEQKQNICQKRRQRTSARGGVAFAARRLATENKRRQAAAGGAGYRGGGGVPRRDIMARRDDNNNRRRRVTAGAEKQKGAGETVT